MTYITGFFNTVGEGRGFNKGFEASVILYF